MKSTSSFAPSRTLAPMPKLMRDLHMREVSGVDRAANLAEGWLLMKSATPATAALLAQATALSKGIDPSSAAPGGRNMPFDAEACKANPEAAAAYIAGLEKAMVTGAPAAVPSEADALAKSLESLPEPVRKTLIETQRRAAEAEEEVRKERDRQELEGFTSLAKSLDSLPEVTAETGALFQKAVHGDRTAVEEVFGLLTKANAVVKSSAAFSEIGSAAPAPDSAEGRIAAFAKSLTESNPSMSMADAMEKAAEANPDLYAEYRSEMNRKNREG